MIHWNATRLRVDVRRYHHRVRSELGDLSLAKTATILLLGGCGWGVILGGLAVVQSIY